MTQIKWSFLFLLLISFFYGCINKKCELSTPTIAYLGFSAGTDTSILKFSFEDCDGDLGSRDTSVFNLFIDYFEYDDSLGYQSVLSDVYGFRIDTALNDTIIAGDTVKAGEEFTYQVYIGKDTVNYEMRIPPLTPDGSNKSITGNIDVALDTRIRFSDKVKYVFYVVDNALNKSNKDSAQISF